MVRKYCTYDKESHSAYRSVERYKRFFKKNIGTALIFTVDEFYVMAIEPCLIMMTGEYFQIENGAGCRSFAMSLPANKRYRG